MKQLNRIENIIFIAGAILMVIGSGAYFFFQPWPQYLFAIGVVAYVLMQLKQTYDGSSVTIMRLRGMLIISDACLLASAFLMFANDNSLLELDYFTYLKYIHNNWVIALLIACVLQLYSTHRISKELEKETKKT